jgi:hypothetical protein
MSPETQLTRKAIWRVLSRHENFYTLNISANLNLNFYKTRVLLCRLSIELVGAKKPTTKSVYKTIG